MVLFEEERKYGIHMATVITSLVTLLFCFGFYKQVIEGVPFGNNPMPDEGLYIAIALMLALTIALYHMKLSLRITKEGVEYRLFPFHLRFKRIRKEDITALEVVTYNPIGEFGGWGLRRGLKGAKAYTLSGDKALRVHYGKSSTVLIGTAQADELRESLMKIRRTLEVE